MIRVRAQGGEVVLVQLGGQSGGRRALGDELQRGALVARDAGHPDQVGGVAGERADVERRECFLLHPSDPSRP